jgi:hypothetical protein
LPNWGGGTFSSPQRLPRFNCRPDEVTMKQAVSGDRATVDRFVWAGLGVAQSVAAIVPPHRPRTTRRPKLLDNWGACGLRRITGDTVGCMKVLYYTHTGAMTKQVVLGRAGYH